MVNEVIVTLTYRYRILRRIADMIVRTILLPTVSSQDHIDKESQVKDRSKKKVRSDLCRILHLVKFVAFRLARQNG